MTTPGDDFHRRLRAAVPYGSSTNSKAATLLPEEPVLIRSGRGCRVVSEDGREFIDFRLGLGPVTLGYRHPVADEAIRRQLADGIVFGHPHRLECEVAERLIAAVPCADRVRFLKTGGEAMAACFRLARAFTGRERIVQIGYNGWLNTLAPRGERLPGMAEGSVPAGVPHCLSALHHAEPWNDPDALERLFSKLPGEIAAVAVAADYPDMAAGKSFYPRLRDITRRHGALLVLDEIVTGFRVARAGVQEYFGTVPDLAVFAKGMANGMPLSAYCGRADIMRHCDAGGNVTISSTYAGEALSLAAAAAVMDLYAREDVVGHLHRVGERFRDGLNGLFAGEGIPLRLRGLGPCAQIVADPGAPDAAVAAFLRAAFARGVSLYRVCYTCYSHRDADVDEALARLAEAVRSPEVQRLRTAPV